MGKASWKKNKEGHLRKQESRFYFYIIIQALRKNDKYSDNWRCQDKVILSRNFGIKRKATERENHMNNESTEI